MMVYDLSTEKDSPFLTWLGRAAAVASVVAVFGGTFVYLEDLKYGTRQIHEQMMSRFDEKKSLDDRWLDQDTDDHAAILAAVLDARRAEQLTYADLVIILDRSEELLIARMLSTTESVNARNAIIISALADLSYRLGQHACQEGN